MTRRRGWYWPFVLVGFLAAVVGCYAAVIYMVASDPSFAVEKDAYQKGLTFSQTLVDRQASDALGWSLDMHVGPAPNQMAEVRAVLTGRDGAPVDGATVDVEAFHNASAANVLTATFSATADHAYTAFMPLRRAGIWEFRVRARRGADTFFVTLTKELGVR